MYSLKRDPQGGGYRCTIRPNRALSWRAVLVFFYLCLFVSLIIASIFIYLGAWPVVPFSGLEMLLLFAGLYAAARRCSRESEWIDIGAEVIEVTTVAGKERLTSCYPRPWARLELHEEERWYASRLWLGSHGRHTEIGKPLSDDDKRRLYHELRQILQG